MSGIESGALISPDGLYRYSLWRRWGAASPLGFVMLNPSTADGEVDDPTIRRCIGFAKREGFGGVTVRNLYAWRATSPKDLLAAHRGGEDIIGPDNWDCLDAFRTSPSHLRVVAAWGAASAFSSAGDRSWHAEHVSDVRRLLGDRLYRFAPPGVGVNPPHPLYLPSETPLESWGCPR